LVTVAALIAAIIAAFKAFEAVDVARRDAYTNSQNLALVRKQYDILAHQIQEHERRPLLMVQFNTGREMRIGDFIFEERESEWVHRSFELQVRNDGQRKTNAVTGHIMVRDNICTSLAGSKEVTVVNGVYYRSAHISASDNVPEKSGWRHLYGGEMTLNLREVGDNFDFLVKLRDEFGETYPKTPTGALIGYVALLVQVEDSSSVSSLREDDDDQIAPL
jgi:hypothetical protein